MLSFRKLLAVGIGVGMIGLGAGRLQAAQADCGCKRPAAGHLSAQPCGTPGYGALAPGCCECPPNCCDNVWAGYCENRPPCRKGWGIPVPGAPMRRHVQPTGCSPCAAPTATKACDVPGPLPPSPAVSGRPMRPSRLAGPSPTY